MFEDRQNVKTVGIALNTNKVYIDGNDLEKKLHKVVPVIFLWKGEKCLSLRE